MISLLLLTYNNKGIYRLVQSENKIVEKLHRYVFILCLVKLGQIFSIAVSNENFSAAVQQ